MSRGWVFTGALVAVIVGFLAATTWTVLLVVDSIGSEEVRLRPGSEKTFGWFDPHLHGAVLEVSTPEAWGEGSDRLVPRDRLWLVAFRLRCSAAEITIDPSFLRVTVVDEGGREFLPLSAPPQGRVTPVTRIEGEVGPDEERIVHFLFELPADSVRPALWVTDPIWINRFIPGHEQSFFHSRIVFELD